MENLNKEAIKNIVDQNTNLMITVDCGISAVDEVKYAKELGLEVIVTDHHETGEEIPEELNHLQEKVIFLNANSTKGKNSFSNSVSFWDSSGSSFCSGIISFGR